MTDDTVPAWDGRPGLSGAYILRRQDGTEFPAWWSDASDTWVLRGGASLRACAIAETGTTLIAPCLTPAEVAALQSAAFAAGAEAMKRAAGERALSFVKRYSHASVLIAQEICRLPLPPMPS